MSKCKITGKVLVIQFGKEETQIVRMSSGADVFSVAVPTPQGAVEDGMLRDPNAVRDMLKSALKMRELKGVRQAVFSLCTSQVITETVTTPDLPEAKLEKLLQANMDMYFPVDMHDYQVVWQVVGPKTSDSGLKELTVQLWAVPNALTQRYYTVANACGLSVAAIDYCGHSVATAVGASFSAVAKGNRKKGRNAEATIGQKRKAAKAAAAEAAGEPYTPDTQLHISLERDLLGMTFVQQGRVVMQRFIRCGADPTYQFGELAMIVEYYRSMEYGRDSEISAFLSGAYASSKNMNDELEEALGMPIALFSDGYSPRLVLCIGAARTTMDFGTPSLNKPGKARREVRSQLWQYALVLAGGAALVLVVLFTLSSQLVWSANTRSLESSLQTLTVQAQQYAGFEDNYSEYASKYASYSADWDTVFSSLQTYNDNLVLALQELEEILPENTSVTNLQIAPDGLNVSFACETKEEAAFLIMALRKLQYADLAAISNLGGGGGGAAESYGSGESEAPPSEGSYDPEKDGQVTVTFSLSARSGNENSAVADLIASELTEDELMDLVSDLTPEQLTLLEQVYGKTPETTYTTLAALKGNTELAITFDHRENALRQMFNTNPFAVNRFVNLLEEDFYRSESILWKYILSDLLQLEEEGKLSSGATDDPIVLREYMGLLLDILTKDDDTLTATEALLCSEAKEEGQAASVSELTYVHYLEVELGLREAEAFPYLNIDAVFTDLLAGGFNTGDTALDARLNGLISDETWALLASMNSNEKMSEMVSDYLTTGTSGEPVVDEIINKYLTEGTTGSTVLDDRIGSYLGSGDMDGQIAELFDKYLTEGTTGSAVMDARVEQYLTDGTTGNAALDARIEAYIKGGQMDKTVTGLFDKYINEGTTGNTSLDAKIDSYISEGTTGSKKLDDIINSYISSGSLNTQLQQMLEKYLKDGTTGNAKLDEVVNRYLTTGTTGNTRLDTLFNELMPEEDPFGGLTDAQIAELFGKYFTTGTTNNETLDGLLNAYFTDGTSGNEKVDSAINSYITSGKADAQMTALVDKYLASGTTGNLLFDNLIDGYFTTGTTGNAALDALIEKHINDGKADSKINELISKYIESGTTGIKAIDKLLNKYVTDGTTGNTKLDGMIGALMPDPGDDPLGDLSQEQIGDLFDKYFSDGTTGNSTIDTLIDKYLASGSTGNDKIDQMITDYISNVDLEEQMTDLLNKYLTEGTTDRAVLDKLIDDYITTGTTGNKYLDDTIEDTLLTSEKVKDTVAHMVDSYLAKGTTGNKTVDKLIEDYLLKGTTGNENLDRIIEDYLEESTDDFKDKIEDMFTDYLTEGSTGYPVFDELIDNYIASGTTGNDFMDKILKEYMNEKMAEIFNKYLKEGTTGNAAFDSLIDKYLTSGTTGNAGLDKLITEYMGSDAVKAMLKELLNKYMKDGTTGNASLDKLIFKYLLTGTTGNAALDKLIADMIGSGGSTGSNPGGTNGDTNWDDILNGIFGNGGTGTGGTPTGPVDTRITLTVALAYNDELKNAELDRKGLDYTDKVDELEVEE